MNHDFIILLLSLAAIGMVGFLPRHVVFGPLIFAWAGGAIGVSLAIMFHYDPSADRVYLQDSLPYFGSGLLCGLVPGVGSMALYRKRSGSRAWIEVSAVTLLSTSIGAIFGSYAGRFSDSKPPPEMLMWIATSLIFGLLVGIAQWRMEGRKLQAKKSAS